MIIRMLIVAVNFYYVYIDTVIAFTKLYFLYYSFTTCTMITSCCPVSNSIPKTLTRLILPLSCLIVS